MSKKETTANVAVAVPAVSSKKRSVICCVHSCPSLEEEVGTTLSVI